MNTISISNGTVKEIKQFVSRGETGADVFIQDKNGYGTAYFQVVYYGAKAENVLANLKTGDSVSISGTLVVSTYPKKNGSQTTIFLIKNPGPMTVQGRDVTVPQYSTVQNDTYDPDEFPFG